MGDWLPDWFWTPNEDSTPEPPKVPASRTFARQVIHLVHIKKLTQGQADQLLENTPPAVAGNKCKLKDCVLGGHYFYGECRFYERIY